MIDMQTIFQIHRLKDEGFSNRAVAIRLKIDKKNRAKIHGKSFSYGGKTCP